MSGVDCLLVAGLSWSSGVSSCFLKGVIFLLGGVKLSLLKIFPNVVLFTPMSGTDGFLSVADNLLFWFLREVLKLSSLARSLVDMFLMFLCSLWLIIFSSGS